LAPALVGRLPANFNACAAQLVLQPGGGGCSTSVLTDKLLQAKKQKFIRVRPLCRNQHKKNYSVRHTAPLANNA
jgi:hypothetical protein